MYRKVAFLFVNIFQFDINLKTALLLLFSCYSVYAMKKCLPFVSKELNALELASNITASIILYSGTLYVNDIGVYWQAFLFINIMISNSLFFILCLLSLIKVFFNANLIKIQYYCPRLMANFISLLKTFKEFRIRKMGFIECIKLYRANLKQESKRSINKTITQVKKLQIAK